MPIYPLAAIIPFMLSFYLLIIRLEHFRWQDVLQPHLLVIVNKIPLFDMHEQLTKRHIHHSKLVGFL